MSNVPSPAGIVIELSARTMAEAKARAAHLARTQGLIGLWMVQALHDDGCRACKSQNDADCQPPCKPEFYLLDYTAFASFMAFDRAMRARLN